MATYEIFHIAIASSAAIEADLAVRVAAIINKDAYGTKLLLSRKVPVIIAHSNTQSNAEKIAGKLRELGLTTTVFTDSELRKSAQTFRAHILKFEPEAILCEDKTRQTFRIESDSVFLVISGKMQTYTETSETETRTEVNVKATLMTGGIPILRKVRQTTKNTTTETECFIRFYNHASAEPCIDIFQHDFNYSCLGAEMTLSSYLNFNLLVIRIKEKFPQVILDTRLMGPPFMSHGNFDINCRLMYWYHLNMRPL
jgi:hypothetical protein